MRGRKWSRRGVRQKWIKAADMSGGLVVIRPAVMARRPRRASCVRLTRCHLHQSHPIRRRSSSRVNRHTDRFRPGGSGTRKRGLLCLNVIIRRDTINVGDCVCIRTVWCHYLRQLLSFIVYTLGTLIIKAASPSSS